MLRTHLRSTCDLLGFHTLQSFLYYTCPLSVEPLSLPDFCNSIKHCLTLLPNWNNFNIQNIFIDVSSHDSVYVKMISIVVITIFFLWSLAVQDSSGHGKKRPNHKKLHTNAETTAFHSFNDLSWKHLVTTTLDLASVNIRARLLKRDFLW